MRSIPQNRSFYRIMMFGLIAMLMIAASWWFTFSRNKVPSFELDSFAADTASRTSASIDGQVQSLQAQLRSHPNDWQSYSQLGLAYLQKARETGDPTYYQKIEGALDQALSLRPDDYTSISAMGALALARHDFSAALEWGKKAQQINPDRTYAYGVIADAQVELGHYEEAIDTLQSMVDLRPDMSSYSRISYIRELHGDMDGALEMMQLAVDSGTPNAESTAWVRTQLANLYFNRGDLKQAELEYQLTLQNRPNYVYALAGLGRVRAAQGSLEEAIEYLNQAVAIMPLPEFVITLGDLCQASGQQEDAERQYQLVAAIETLYRANGVDLDMEIALFNADHDKNMTETVALARKAYANRPSIHGADALAWALYKSGNYADVADAQTYMEEALKLGTKDSLKLFHAGMIALQLGEKTQAREYLEQALAINPHFSILYTEEARRILEILNK
jgi:tetratricopeptide (TPR) repeat protein